VSHAVLPTSIQNTFKISYGHRLTAEANHLHRQNDRLYTVHLAGRRKTAQHWQYVILTLVLMSTKFVTELFFIKRGVKSIDSIARISYHLSSCKMLLKVIDDNSVDSFSKTVHWRILHSTQSNSCTTTLPFS